MQQGSIEQANINVIAGAPEVNRHIYHKPAISYSDSLPKASSDKFVTMVYMYCMVSRIFGRFEERGVRDGLARIRMAG